MVQLLTRLIIVIISQHIQISNNYVVHLKLIGYKSIILYLNLKKYKKQKKWGEQSLTALEEKHDELLGMAQMFQK